MRPSEPEWPTSFERERQRIEPIFEHWLVCPIEHIGSTAIPGLVAKPIIDMVAVVQTMMEPAAVSSQLQRVDWFPAPEPYDEAERRLSFCHPSVARRTHHLHVVEEDSEGWRGWIAFRDYLRTQPELCIEYGSLKTRLAAEHGSDPNSREAYRLGKSEWVLAMTRRALSDGRPF